MYVVFCVMFVDLVVGVRRCFSFVVDVCCQLYFVSLSLFVVVVVSVDVSCCLLFSVVGVVVK